MSTPQILKSIREQASALVAEKLRSTAVVIARLEPLITEANELGHTHVAIHAAIKAGGVDTSMNNYKVYLHRARQRRSKAPSPRAVTLEAEFFSNQSGGISQHAESSHPVEAKEPEVPPTRSDDSVTSVRDSLQKAKQIATRDFSKIAKQQLRKPAK